MLARCRVHEVSQEWGCEWGSSYMNESIHSVSSQDCTFLRSRMRCSSLLITRRVRLQGRLAASLRLRARRRRRRQVRWWTQPAAAGGGRTRWSRRASCAARSCWRSGRRAGGRRAQLAWRSGTPAAGVIQLSGRPPRRRRRPNGPSTRGGAAAAPGVSRVVLTTTLRLTPRVRSLRPPGVRESGARCAGRPPTRGAPEAAGSGYGRGGRKTKNGWPALAGPGLAGDCWFVVPVRFCDWARGLDGVYLLTRRELFALQPRPLCYRFRLVTVVVVTKSRLPKVGSPTLGSVVVRRTAGAGYPEGLTCTRVALPLVG